MRAGGSHHDIRLQRAVVSMYSTHSLKQKTRVNQGKRNTVGPKRPRWLWDLQWVGSSPRFASFQDVLYRLSRLLMGTPSLCFDILCFLASARGKLNKACNHFLIVLDSFSHTCNFRTWTPSSWPRFRPACAPRKELPSTLMAAAGSWTAGCMRRGIGWYTLEKMDLVMAALECPSSASARCVAEYNRGWKKSERRRPFLFPRAGSSRLRSSGHSSRCRKSHG